ncbi:MAG: hypothetical protein ABH879_09350 [archaeon]
MRRAQIEMSAKPIIGLILAAGIIVLTMGFFSKVWASFTADETDLPTLYSFSRLSNKTQDLILDPAPYASTIMPLYIKDDWGILVGFDTEWKNYWKADQCPVTLDREIQRPLECFSRGCLCLFSDDLDKVEQCTGFRTPGNEKVIFLAPDRDGGADIDGATRDDIRVFPREDPTSLKDSYEYLVAYGDCGTPWNTQNVFIEKIRQGDTIYITMVPLNDPENEKDTKLRGEALGRALSESNI